MIPKGLPGGPAIQQRALTRPAAAGFDAGRARDAATDTTDGVPSPPTRDAGATCDPAVDTGFDLEIFHELDGTDDARVREDFALSRDERTIIFSVTTTTVTHVLDRAVTSTRRDLHRAVRAGIGARFAAPALLPLATAGAEAGEPALSRDGRELVWTRLVDGRGEVRLSTRGDDGTYDEGVPITIDDAPVTEARSPVLLDGALYYAASVPGMGERFLRAPRAGVGAFGSPQAAFDVYAGPGLAVSADERALYASVGFTVMSHRPSSTSAWGPLVTWPSYYAAFVPRAVSADECRVYVAFSVADTWHFGVLRRRQ